jgi:preprotein translocase subunit SecA
MAFNIMFGFLKKLFGSNADRVIQKYEARVDSILQWADEYAALSNDELRSKTFEFRERIQAGLQEINDEILKTQQMADDEGDITAKDAYFREIDALKKDRNAQMEVELNEILPEAFAVMKETAKRFTENEFLTVTATQHDRDLAAKPGKSHIKIEGDQAHWAKRWMAAGGEVEWNMVHYDVQLIGGMVLHDGKIAEMATGEGKTLVATLPAYLNGLSGLGVHIITVNDYLARRDSEWIGPVLEFLFLNVDCIDKHRPNSAERRKAYLADITYGTNNEFGFDYLRDNMVHSLDEMVQRKHHYGMVDEVDSVLIDDARTPLIISGPTYASTDDKEYIKLNPKIKDLFDAQRKIATDQLTMAKKLIEQGNAGVEEGGGGLALLRSHRAYPKNRALVKFLSEEGMKTILTKTENHYMAEQSKHMHKVDTSLLFTIDEKNRSSELTENGADYMARGMDDTEFFVLQDIALKMMELEADQSLTPEEKLVRKEEEAITYSIKSQRLHTVNQLLKAYTLFDIDQEYVVMDGEVKIVDEQTGRIMDGRRYSDGLHQALEAKENVEVGETTQTYATITLQNYFRMYHKLAGMTGTAETEASELWQIYKLEVVVIPTNRDIVRNDNEDLIFKTSREKFNAVVDEIEQLRNAGRPILVGTTSVEISELLSRFMQMRGIPHNVLNAKQHQREAEIVAEAGLPGKVTIATNMAGRGTDIKLGPGVKEAGGLAIIGTERHDSRRVDRQLRGRAGRQGDPGSSQFYVSLEDKLMRLFQSDMIAKTMDRMGHKEGDVIQHKMVTKSIERAQTKVEENNFGVRKRLLEYDDIMNIQREVIYTKRYNALSGERLSVDLNRMFDAHVTLLVDEHYGKDFAAFRQASITELAHDPAELESEFKSLTKDTFTDAFFDQVMTHYGNKANRITEAVLPIVKDVKAREGDRFSRVAIPFANAMGQQIGIGVDINKAIASDGRSIMTDIEKVTTLGVIDDTWKEHLRNMDDLKEQVQSASFEQKDPLVIYKIESYGLFESLVTDINIKVTSALMQGGLMIQQGPPQNAVQHRPAKAPVLQTNKVEDNELSESQRQQRHAAQNVNQGPKQPPVQVVRQEPKVGRNDACPCGSGKKFKVCHGR